MNRYPLSKTEYGIYIEQITNRNTAYNLPFLVTLPDGVDTYQLERAIRAAVAAHPCLFTSFAVDENGEAYKYRREESVQIERVQTNDFEPYGYVVPFDLHSDRLYRFYIVTTPSEQ